MKISIFGSCSGTLPFDGRHHTAFAITVNDRTYWFDAGENSSYTAYLMGVDLLSISDIFISHPHMDHIGGLGNLLWNIRKLSTQSGTLPYFGGVSVYSPNLETLSGILTTLKHTEGNYQTDYSTAFHKITDSVLLENQDVKVEAIHNHHLPQTDDGWQSFSFRITAENKRLIYSGDIHSIEDLSEFLKDGCDTLFIETGHHDAEVICKRIRQKGYAVNALYFLHHGRKILNDFEGVLRRCKNLFIIKILGFGIYKLSSYGVYLVFKQKLFFSIKKMNLSRFEGVNTLIHSILYNIKNF